MTYKVEFWTREVNVIEVEADDMNELVEKCEEIGSTDEYVWNYMECADSGWDIIEEVRA